MFEKAIDKMYEIVDAGKVNKSVIKKAQQFGGLIEALQKGGYLTKAEFTQLQDLKYYVTQDGEIPDQEIVDTASKLLFDLSEKYMEDDGNALAIFDQELGKLRLSPGVHHVPERVKQKAVDVHEGLINVTMSPSTASMTKVRVWVPQATSLGPRKAISKLVLGDLTQGLPQKLFFGVLRNFWYSKQMDPDIKRYLAIRYLREFRQIDGEDVYAIRDKAGDIVRFIEPEIYGFVGQGAPGASQKQIDKTDVRNPRDVAIRTWIQTKNLPAAQTIPGMFKYAYVGM